MRTAWIVAGGAAFVALLLAAWTERVASTTIAPDFSLRAIRYAELPPSWAHDVTLEAAHSAPRPVRSAVRWGDTLTGLLEAHGLARVEAHFAAAELTPFLRPSDLKAGTDFTALVAPGAETPSTFLFDVPGRGRAVLSQGGEGWTGSFREFVLTRHQRSVAGTLVGGLESSLTEAGAPPALAYALAEVLQWDLDFNRDLRLGDEFQIVYETSHLDGDYFRVESIDAARYSTRGRTLEAFRFGEEPAYYDHEGRPLQKQFLRSPLPYSRVTSRFNLRRFHPVLKTVRPHYGVDYGAPRGTPVRVTASGVVDFVGTNGGAGKMIRVRHPNGYSTSYLHLSGYAQGVRRGIRVRQGDEIGYVGSTGLSTGPHLDYRMKQNGQWIDPLTLRNEPAPPLAEEKVPEFQRRRDNLNALLATAD